MLLFVCSEEVESILVKLNVKIRENWFILIKARTFPGLLLVKRSVIIISSNICTTPPSLMTAQGVNAKDKFLPGPPQSLFRLI